MSDVKIPFGPEVEAMVARLRDVAWPLIGWSYAPLLTLEQMVTSDVTEGENALTITVSLPGFDGEDVTVSVRDTVLTVDAECEGENVHRTFRLTDALDVEQMRAHFEDDVLTLTIPKREARGGQ